MEVRPTELEKHAKQINAILQAACDANDPAPLVHLTDGTIALAATCPPMLRRDVITDLGRREIALRLPIPSKQKPRFWITLQEQWKSISRHKWSFVQSGLQLLWDIGTKTPFSFSGLNGWHPWRIMMETQYIPADMLGIRTGTSTGGRC